MLIVSWLPSPEAGSGSQVAELVPALGEPVAVQRTLEFALAPGLDWTVHGVLDLETVPERDGRTCRR